jgi:hypothetical protein
MTVNDGGMRGMHALAGHESWKERAPCMASDRYTIASWFDASRLRKKLAAG